MAEVTEAADRLYELAQEAWNKIRHKREEITERNRLNERDEAEIQRLEKLAAGYMAYITPDTTQGVENG